MFGGIPEKCGCTYCAVYIEHLSTPLFLITAAGRVRV
jgi:hypothetical protein